MRIYNPLPKSMAVLNLIKMGHPTLREQSLMVGNELSSSTFQQFLDDLTETMRHYNGVGIAAPQVNILKRVFLMEMKDNSRYPDKNSFPLYTIINPEITYVDNQLVDSWEGCLSIPNIRGRLKRHQHIILKGLNREGDPIEEYLDGFAAIVAQHEMDHLNGTLFIDKMGSMQTLTFYEEYQEYWL